MAIRSTTRTRTHRPIHINMTSMVDIVFLLIIFFVMVSSFISAENLRVDLPDPDESVAESAEIPDRVVLNCEFIGGWVGSKSSVRYHLGPILLDSVKELEARLAAVRQDRPDVQVLVRADRRVRYKLIRDAMAAIARAGIKEMNIVAEIED